MITVRPAAPNDAAELAVLSGELGYPSSEAQVSARLTALTAGAGHAVFVASDETARIVGWVHVYRYLVLESEARAEIGGLVTAPAARRRGVGRLLMARAEAWARTEGLRMAGVRTNERRRDAHAFYEAIGYERTKVQVSFRKALD